MLYLALAVACGLAVTAIFKVSEQRELDRVALLTVNYGVAGALAGVLVARSAEGLAISLGLAAFGLGVGALFILGFSLFSRAIFVAGMALATGVMRLSVAVPFLASWWVWGEVPSAAQGLGLGLAGIAFFLVVRREAPAEAQRGDRVVEPHTVATLAALFVAGGLADTSLKVFDEAFAAEHSRALFLLLTFGAAFALGGAIVLARGLRRGRWPRADVLAPGVALGLANYGTVAFFLQAVARLPGPFVFPANNIAIVMGAALLGVLVWGERLSRANAAGLALAALALALLSV